MSNKIGLAMVCLISTQNVLNLSTTGSQIGLSAHFSTSSKGLTTVNTRVLPLRKKFENNNFKMALFLSCFELLNTSYAREAISSIVDTVISNSASSLSSSSISFLIFSFFTSSSVFSSM